jgi:hypothetical protein
MKQTKTCNVFVEELCAVGRGAKVIENATAEWIAGLDGTIQSCLAKLGLNGSSEDRKCLTPRP